MPKYYSFNWATREYIGEDEADPDPLTPGEWLLPAYSTFKAPPEEIGPDEQAVFDSETNEWKKEKLPPPPPVEFEKKFAEIPVYSLVGDEMIGDLFDADK
jgi:hypothetical protein